MSSLKTWNIPPDVARWIFAEMWSLNEVPSSRDFQVYAKAIMVCAKGDGELDESERRWVLGYMGVMGMPREGLDELSVYEGDDDLHHLLRESAFVRRSKRSIVYDAIRACSADGELHEEELATISAMASVLDLNESVVQQIKEAHDQEREVRRRRQEVLFAQASGE